MNIKSQGPKNATNFFSLGDFMNIAMAKVFKKKKDKTKITGLHRAKFSRRCLDRQIYNPFPKND